MRRLLLVRLAAFLALTSVSAPLFAQASAMDRCTQFRNQLDASLWTEFRNLVDQTVCRRPWSTRLDREWLACAAADNIGKLGSLLKSGMNSYFGRHNAEWATLGPRYVGSGTENGTIQGGFKRTFIGAGLPYVTSDITVEKRDGRAEGLITVCRVAMEGNRILTAQRFTFANGNDNIGRRFNTSLANTEPTMIGVIVDTPAGLNSFSYSVQLQDSGGIGGPRVTGLADLHLHQLADRGFGGRIIMGDHTGPQSTALAPDQISPGATNLVELGRNLILRSGGPIARLLMPNQTSLSIDANILMPLSQLPMGEALGRFVIGPNGDGVSSFANRSEDGFFQVAMPGGGAPDFRTWPNHADRGHQQAHIDWLREAHQRGLKLVVVSMVHSPMLCNVFTKFDAYGNVGLTRTNATSHAWNCDTQANINRQIAAAQALDRDLDWYEIVMSPKHARHVIAEGKLAVVLSIESDGVLNYEFGQGDFEEELLRLRTQGVSTLQMTHERDSRFCGAAPHRNEMENLQFARWGLQGNLDNPRALFDAAVDFARTGTAFNRDPQTGRNRVGLQADGVELLDLMMGQGMPVDIAHASVACKRDIFARVANRTGGYGLYDSHTKFERMINPALNASEAGRGENRFVPPAFDREEEFMVTEDVLADYRRHRVLVGLRTAAVDIYSAPPRTDGRAGVANTCPGSVRSFAQLVDYATAQGLPIAFGSDINGMIAQIGPRIGPGRCYAAFVPGGRPERAADEDGEGVPPSEARMADASTARTVAPATQTMGSAMRPATGTTTASTRPPSTGSSSAATGSTRPPSTGTSSTRPPSTGTSSTRPPSTGSASAATGSAAATPAPSGAMPSGAGAIVDTRIVAGSVKLTMPVAPPRTLPAIGGKTYARDGLAHVAWLPEVYEDLKILRTPGVDALGDGAEAYIQMWERAWAQRN